MNKTKMLMKAKKLNDKSLASLPKMPPSEDVGVTHTSFLGYVQQRERGFWVYVPVIAAKNAKLKDGERREFTVK